MRPDHSEILKNYSEIFVELEAISIAIEKELENRVGKEKHVDRVICRCKTIDSFMKKAEKKDENGKYKYEVPIKEIQDKIGARVVVYYKSDVVPILEIVTTYFKHIEEKIIVPDDVSKFGYEGFHAICKIPNNIYPLKNNLLVGDFFELQIKTLYQHAWSQSNHGLGYKGKEKLKDEEVRLLAFIAAQSWGADKGLMELADENRSNKYSVESDN
jgi:putative GTP pyrophosphokinase